MGEVGEEVSLGSHQVGLSEGLEARPLAGGFEFSEAEFELLLVARQDQSRLGVVLELLSLAHELLLRVQDLLRLLLSKSAHFFFFEFSLLSADTLNPIQIVLDRFTPNQAPDPRFGFTRQLFQTDKPRDLTCHNRLVIDLIEAAAGLSLEGGGCWEC